PNNVVNDSEDFTSRTSTSGFEEQVDNVYSPQEALSSSTSLGINVQSSDSMCNKFGSVHNNLFKNNNASLSQFCYDKISKLDIAKDTGIANSGCSKSISGNRDTLDDFVDFDGGPVRFGGSNGMITGKGTIKTKHLDFKNVLYVPELEHFNLISISQVCDQSHRVLFTGNECLVLSKDFPLPDPSMVILSIPRTLNLYTFSLEELAPQAPITCLFAKASQDESNLWHRRLGHVNFRNMNKLVKGNLVRGLPNKMFPRDQTCIACNKGKQHNASYKGIPLVSLITTPLHLLYMDLFGPTFMKSITNKYYCLVITDEFTRCDNGTEFKNANLIALCATKGIKRDYNNARTPQQNGTEAVATTCYMLNRVLVAKPYNKTPYELLTGDKPAIGYLKPFGCQVTILNISDYLGKFDEKDDEGYIIGYSIPGNQGPSSNNVGCQDLDSDSDDAQDVIIVQNSPTLVTTPVHDVPNHEEAAQPASSIPTEKSSSVSPASTPTASAGNTPPVSSRPSTSHSSKSTGKKLASSYKTPIPAGRSVSADKPIPAGRSISANKPIPTGRSVSTDKSIPAVRSISASRDTNSANRHPSKLSSNAAFERFPPALNTQNSDIHDGLKLFDFPSTGIFSSSSYDDKYHGHDISNQEKEILVNPVNTKKVNEAQPHSLIIGDLHTPVQTRKKAKAQVPIQNAFVSYIHDQRRNNHTDFQLCLFSCFLSQMEPTSVAQALLDPDWVEAMQEELQQFQNQRVWFLVELHERKHVIRTKWILKNKRDARGIVCRNKARLVAQVYIHNHKDYLEKFDEKADNGYLFGYSLVSKAFRVFNTRRHQTEETYHITFDESPNAIKFLKPSFDNINIVKNERYPPDEYLHPYQPSQSNLGARMLTRAIAKELGAASAQECLFVDFLSEDEPKKDKHIELLNIIGNLGARMLTRAIAKELGAASAQECLFVDFLSEDEPKKVFKDKRDETGIVIKNKARLVAQGYNQQEGIDYDETIALVARHEAIIIFLAFATYMNFIVLSDGCQKCIH
nr:hypothetical protein [Tanacetum cinerariifolium]